MNAEPLSDPDRPVIPAAVTRPETVGRNLALGKPADQSSMSQWSHGGATAQDAAGAVDGIITGKFQFHTAEEMDPWWSVDLGDTVLVAKIKIFNRSESESLAARLLPFSVMLSLDGKTWSTVHTQSDGPAPAGADGKPLVIELSPLVPGRQIKVQKHGYGFLHLDQVEVFGSPPTAGKPEMPPEKPHSCTQATRHRVSIIACARWETRYIGEWLTYHRAIGFDHVYLYCNDDNPAELYAAVLPFCQGPTPFVTFHHFPYAGQQQHIYHHCLRTHGEETEWALFLDIDEFLNIRHTNSIQPFLDTVPADWDCVYFNWIMFGHNGHDERPDGSVLLNYTMRAVELDVLTKSMVRVCKVDIRALGNMSGYWHVWHGMGENFNGRDVLGARYPYASAEAQEQYLRQPGLRDRIVNCAVIHHYMFKSEQDLVIRARRGSLGNFQGQWYWEELYKSGEWRELFARHNAIEDRILAEFWERQIAAGRLLSVVPLPIAHNLALGKPANQSSMSEWSRGATTEQDAAGAVNGVVTGRFQFHTSEEVDPWWSVDLIGVMLLGSIRIFNRCESESLAGRLLPFSVMVSDDAVTWSVIYSQTDGSPPGGADSRPLSLELSPPVQARYVKAQKHGRGFLHLDQVEIYGAQPASEDSIEIASSNTPLGRI